MYQNFDLVSSACFLVRGTILLYNYHINYYVSNEGLRSIALPNGLLYDRYEVIIASEAQDNDVSEAISVTMKDGSFFLA